MGMWIIKPVPQIGLGFTEHEVYNENTAQENFLFTTSNERFALECVLKNNTEEQQKRGATHGG